MESSEIFGILCAMNFFFKQQLITHDNSKPIWVLLTEAEVRTQTFTFRHPIPTTASEPPRWT